MVMRTGGGMRARIAVWGLVVAGGFITGGCASTGGSSGIVGKTGGAAQQEDDRPVIIRQIGQAVKIADAVLVKEYGPEAAAAQHPLHAVIINNNHWIVTGSPVNGKVAEVRLRVAGGGVVSVQMLPAAALKGRVPEVQPSSAEALGYYE